MADHKVVVKRLLILHRKLANVLVLQSVEFSFPSPPNDRGFIVFRFKIGHVTQPLFVVDVVF